MAHTQLTAESAALIADTENQLVVELPIAQSILTVSRELENGQPVRKFRASATINGQVVFAVAGKKTTAHTLLVKAVRAIGFEPQWTALHDHTDITDEPKSNVKEQAWPDELPAAQSETPAEEPGEHECPTFGLTVNMPKLDRSGLLTPVSDPTAYIQVYLAAWKMATGFSPYQFKDLSREGANIRASIGALMLSGEAGAEAGIPCKAVNPWALGTNGQQEMCWVRVIPRTPDPTTKPFKAGDGEARETFLNTLSGLPVHPDRQESARASRERRAARFFQGHKGIKGKAQENALVEKQAQAHKAGQAAKDAAYKAGHGELAEIHYKWIYCATLRVLGEIHTVYESQLAEAGVTVDQILVTVNQMRAA